MVSPQFVSNFLLAWRSNLSSFRDSSGSSQKAGAEKANMKGVPQNLFFFFGFAIVMRIMWRSFGSAILDQIHTVYEFDFCLT